MAKDRNFDGRSKQPHVVPVVVVFCTVIYIGVSVSRSDFKDAMAGRFFADADGVEEHESVTEGLKLDTNQIAGEVNKKGREFESLSPYGGQARQRLILLEHQPSSSFRSVKSNGVALRELGAVSRESSSEEDSDVVRKYPTCADVRPGYWPKPRGLMQFSKYSLSGRNAAQWKKGSRNRFDRCAFIGAHSTALTNDFGEAIDSHDVVLRISDEVESSLKIDGTKTTLWLSDGRFERRSARRRLLKEGSDKDGLYFVISSNDTIGSASAQTSLWESMEAFVEVPESRPDVAWLHVSKSLVQSSAKLPQKYRELLQCSFSSGFNDEVQVPKKHKPSASWVALYMLMNGCKHVTAYGVLQEPTVYRSNGRIPSHLVSDNSLSAEITDAVEEVLLRSLGNAGYMEICGQDALQDCGLKTGVSLA